MTMEMMEPGPERPADDQGPPAAGAEPSPPVPLVDAARTAEVFRRLEAEIRKVFVGQEELLLATLTALVAGGHVLIESVPGLGKTLFVRSLARALGCRHCRIQFTADLMPSDLTGSLVFDAKTGEFRLRPGPVFTQILLADEINRSPAKTHAALLEVMQEYSVSIDRTTYEVKRPFLVLATQNPIESEGTYNLPEAQLDRFLFKVRIDYPGEDEEAEILVLHRKGGDAARRPETALEPVTTPEEILEVQAFCDGVRVHPAIVKYANRIVRSTREWPGFYLGASPRAGLALLRAGCTHAAFRGRDYVVPDDITPFVLPALRHRVILLPEAEVEGKTVDGELEELLRRVEVPRLEEAGGGPAAAAR